MRGAWGAFHGTIRFTLLTPIVRQSHKLHVAVQHGSSPIPYVKDDMHEADKGF
jgi:hypothetical protein